MSAKLDMGISRRSFLASASSAAAVAFGTREKVATLKKRGKSLDEIVAAKLTAATDAKWGNGFRSPKDFIGDVFQGV